MSQKIITINGTAYDAHTGLPVASETAKKPAAAQPAEKVASRKPATASHSIHTKTQKSQTLNRKIVQKSRGVTMDGTMRSSAKTHHTIQKFASHPKPIAQKIATTDIAPVQHPAVHKAHTLQQQKQKVTSQHPKPSAIIKKDAEHAALRKAPSHSAAAHKKHTPKQRKTPRLMSLASAGLALLLMGGYFTYINMPNLSVRVAAAQAGIDATYPSYRPDGYSLNGPVAYDKGQVRMKFATNTNAGNFTVTQSKTAWDSTAVKENYVKDQWGDEVIQYAERGLTIYAHDSNAVWVNAGILYTIEGDAPLSASQIRNIATSM